MGFGRARTGTVEGVKVRTVAICAAIALVCALVAGLIATVLLTRSDGSSTATGSTLSLSDQEDRPDPLTVDLLTRDDTATTLGDQLTGKPTVVNLWAQSCAPCVKEMPLLEQAAKDNPHIAVLGVDTQDDLERAEQMATRTGVTYPWIQDVEGELFYALGGAGMPTTVAVNPEGQVLASHTGAFKTQGELQDWIDTYLGAEPATTTSTGPTAGPTTAPAADGTSPP